MRLSSFARTWPGRVSAILVVALLAAAVMGAGCLLPPQPDDDRPDLDLDDDDDDDTTPPPDDDDDDDDDDFTPGDDDDDDDFTPGDDDDTGTDQDGDGYSTQQGDCNDHDASIYPGATDICDQVDNDCDGRVNEDSVGYDQYEPNDGDGYDLGDLTGTSDQLHSYIHNDADTDNFLFFVEDGWIDWFAIDVSLTGVPQGVDLSLNLLLVDDADHQFVGVVASSDSGGPGGDETLHLDGDYWGDDTGTYQVAISTSQGYDCDDPYTLWVSGGGA